MTYIIHPVLDGVVTDGQTVSADYSWASQEQARALCAILNPDATGTACSWAGDEVFPGDTAGEHLEVETPVNLRGYSFREVGLPTPSSLSDCNKVIRRGRVFKFGGEYRDVVDMTTAVCPILGEGWCIVTTHEETMVVGPIPTEASVRSTLDALDWDRAEIEEVVTNEQERALMLSLIDKVETNLESQHAVKAKIQTMEKALSEHAVSFWGLNRDPNSWGWEVVNRTAAAVGFKEPIEVDEASITFGLDELGLEGLIVRFSYFSVTTVKLAM